MNFDHERRVLTVTQTNGKTREFDLVGMTTVTNTVSGADNTWVVS